MAEKELDVLKMVETALNQEYSYGHPGFTRMMLEKIRLFSEKNHDYAKGGDTFGNFKRQAAIYKNYPGLDLSDPKVVLVVHMFKQVDALLWGLSQKIEHRVEGPVSRLGDILVYAGIEILLFEELMRAGQAETQAATLYIPGPVPGEVVRA